MISRFSYITRAAALALAALPTVAPAQFASPVASSGQQDTTGQAGDATTAIAVPAINPAPYQPVVIDNAIPASTRNTTAEASAPRPEEPRPVLPPNEFETFSSIISGKPLRRFGAELLLPGAGNYVAPPTTAIPPDYRLNPGDVLLIGLSGSVQSAGLRLTIDSEGRVFIPRVGAVMVGGVRYGDVHAAITRQVERQYRSFQLEVTVARLHGLTVYVTGFAASPGSYTVNSLSTLVNAVLAAGGPSAGGSFRSIQLRRGGRLVSDFDLYDLLLKGDQSGDALLQNGDVIFIAPAGEEVAVFGSVNHEAIFEVGPGETLNDAILYAGGVSTVADGSRLMLLDSLGRRDGGWQQIGPEEARTRKAERGDIVRVLSNVAIARPIGQQSVLVTISGEVARPGRYYFSPGMRLADVVAHAGGLTADAFPYASVITRETVRQQQQVSYERAIRDAELLLTAQPVTSANRAELIQPANLTLVRSIVEQLRERKPDGRLVFDLPPDAAALPADLVVENNDTIYVPSRPVTVGVFGAVPSPASFAYREGAKIRDFIQSAGGIQNMGDKSEIFVVRANGTVIANGRGVMGARALPGDLVYVPIDANRGEFWARLRDITGTLFGGLVGAASIKALAE